MLEKKNLFDHLFVTKIDYYYQLAKIHDHDAVIDETDEKAIDEWESEVIDVTTVVVIGD